MSPVYVDSAHQNPLLRNPALGRAATALAVYEGAVQVSQRIRGQWRERFAYTVTVTQGDPIYSDVHQWLVGMIPETKNRALAVSSRRGRSDEPVTTEDPGRTTGEPLRIMMNAEKRRRIEVDGHSIWVMLHKPENSPTATTRQGDFLDKIEFTCRTHDAQQAVLGHLRRIHAERDNRKPMLSMVTAWGQWRSRGDLPMRSLSSVILPADQKNAIVEDLRMFLASEERYNRLAIPYHRGYLFHGDPGTGKTSLVRGLASEFGLDLWYISLADLKDDASLLNLLAEVGPHSILLLEDIDTIRVSHDRESRPGQVSMEDQTGVLMGAEDVLNVSHDTPLARLTTADVAEVFKRHLNDPDAARKALDEAVVG